MMRFELSDFEREETGFLRIMIKRAKIHHRIMSCCLILKEWKQDFSCRDLHTIRNKSAYLMGCLNKRKDALGYYVCVCVFVSVCVFIST